MSKLTIGADPELALINPLTSRYVSAQSVFRPDDNQFGLDGNPTTLELRPLPADNPLQLVENIYRVLDEAKDKYPQVFRLQLKSSDTNIMVGGHIHFGHPKLKETRNYENSRLALDYLLAPLIAMVEIPKHRSFRLSSSYGKLGDMRSQLWGVEYRTPASWIATRKLAESVTSLSYSIVDQLLKDSSWIPAIFKIITYSDLKDLHNRNMLSVLRFFIPHIVRDIHGLNLANIYKKEIDYLIRSARQGKPLLATEIKEGWAIKFITLADMKLANLTDLIKKLGEAIAIPNDDHRVENLIGSGNDFRASDIANNISLAIHSILGGELLSLLTNPIFFKLRGLKADRGNHIQIELPILDSRHHVLKDLISSLCEEMGYPIPEVHFESGSSVYLPRQMREMDNYLSEAVGLVIWLFCNREAYDSKTKTKNGRVIQLPFSKKNAIEPLVEMIKDKKRPNVPTGSDFIDDGGEILVNKFLEYVNSYLIPRLQEARSHESRLRLPYQTRELIRKVFLMSGDPSRVQQHLLDLYEGSFS